VLMGSYSATSMTLAFYDVQPGTKGMAP
jgi:hypothetical protein